MGVANWGRCPAHEIRSPRRLERGHEGADEVWVLPLVRLCQAGLAVAPVHEQTSELERPDRAMFLELVPGVEVERRAIFVEDAALMGRLGEDSEGADREVRTTALVPLARAVLEVMARVALRELHGEVPLTRPHAEEAGAQLLQHRAGRLVSHLGLDAGQAGALARARDVALVDDVILLGLNAPLARARAEHKRQARVIFLAEDASGVVDACLGAEDAHDSVVRLDRAEQEAEGAAQPVHGLHERRKHEDVVDEELLEAFGHQKVHLLVPRPA
mmetsp:Transcript_18149/g.47879  ORF Transcript_18149/g.47879 Transcript_18149/m.47879 type:complete len:273 (+) Transcript_18149:187-1005(+)